MGKYEDALASLNDAQRLAVNTTEGPVLVIAGPGTGKTQLLTTRIAHILATTDALPQNILCLTFTESGAQTMRERLADMIGQQAYDVTISTYHAFGSDIIRRNPDYFADDPDLEPIDDLGIDSIFRQIAAGLPFTNPFAQIDAYLGDIKTLVSDAKRSLLTPDDIRAVAQHNLDYIAAASPIISAALGDLVRVSKKSLPAFEQLAPRLHDLAKSTATLTQQEVACLAHYVSEELDEALAEVARTGTQTPLTKWKNSWLAKDSQGDFVVDGKKANQKLLAAADIYEQYLRTLKERSLFDYDDMILRAVRALETHNDLRFTLQEQYLYILLDEFQDTNGAQLKIVELLTDNPVHEGRPNVLAVGDDDQAIYAFQGAHYSHMLRFSEMYRDVLAVPLTANYRSHADILHTARGIASQIEERLHHHFPAIEKTLTAQNSRLPKEAVIERREAQSDVMQFAWVAKRIQQLIAEGVPPGEIAVLAPQHKYLEPLMPFLAELHIPVRYDKRENILDDPAINQLLRMAELCIALDSGQQREADALWAEVLSFEFWQLPTSLIWKLAWQTNDEDETWTDVLLNHPELKPIALFFIRLSQIVSQETLEVMLDYLIGSMPLDLNEPGYERFTSSFYRHYFGQDTPHDSGRLEQLSLLSESQARADFWNVLTNLIVLRARLREYKRDSDRPLELSDLLAFVAAHRAAELKVLNTSPYVSGGEAVQIMTAFKAKGMEFNTVFVLAVHDQAWGSKARSATNRISLPANLQHIRYAGATDDERLRLFYVAITRAKARLYLVSYEQTYAGKKTSHLRYLEEATNDLYQLESPLLPSGKQLVRPIEESNLRPDTELAAYWQQRHEKALSRDELRHLLQERLTTFQLSPTHINDFTDVVYCGPAAFFLKTVLRFPWAPRPEVQFGNAMHETLEWIQTVVKREGLLPSASALDTAFEKRLQSKRLTTAQTDRFLKRGQAALAAYLQQRGNSIGPDDIAEANFRHEGVFIGNAHLTGKIDRLIIDKTAKTITIVDYKTGKAFNRWERVPKLHKYRLQLYMYRILVEQSHTYAGYTVKDAYLEFVEPDDEGNICQLHLVFDEKEYARVKKLAESVWQHIMTLSLPSIESYSQDMTGLLAFETDLLH